MLELIGDSGPAVLLLPGGAEAVEGFFPGLAEGLMDDPGCRVLLYDRPGVTGSDVAGGLADATSAIHATIADLGTGPVVVIGQSLGGAVGVMLAHDHPDDVAGLVLLDPTPFNDPAIAGQIVRRARTAARLSTVPGVGALLTWLLRSSATRSAKRHGMGSDARAAIMKMIGTDLPHLAASTVGLQEIADAFEHSRLPRVPAVVVTADRRPSNPVHIAHERLATALGASMVMWPRAEHAVHLTHQADVLDVSREVVRAVAASDRAA